MTIVLAAAGTGGHVYPALAVAEALVERGVPRGEVAFFGGERLAAVAVPEAGFPFTGFDLPRLRRAWTIENLQIPRALRRTTRAMATALDRLQAGAVLGMSGYVTVPAAMAARRRDLPFFLQEQNASPGLASRFAARRAVATFLGLPGSSERLSRSRVVGNPLRSSFREFDRAALRAEARARYGLDDGSPTVGILGGSLGAQVLNEAAPAIARAVGDGGGAVVHLTGPAADMTSMSDGGPVRWRCLAYEDRMELFYAAADLVVARAGAMTVSELAATSTPAVLVPLESVGQQANAAALAEAGGAVVVFQRDRSELPRAVEDLLGDPQRLRAMAASAHGLHRGDAAGEIADALLEVFR